ncbi:MAG: 30S ribosomal protein S6 [Candidatus Aminicenantes bacterium]|jgi:small subunit ribosomal protein S6
MTQYETAFLLSPNLEEEETEKIIGQMVEVVSKKKGKMINEDRWGKRKLAYPIKKFEEAFYVFFLYEGDSDIPFELERRFKQSEAVLRYLTVKKEPKKSVRRKKKADSMEKGKEATQEEKALEGETAETVTPEKEGIEEKAPEEAKEAAKKVDVKEDDEPEDKKKAARKKDKVDKEEEVDKEKTGDEKAPGKEKVSAEKKEVALKDVAPPDEEKEEK